MILERDKTPAAQKENSFHLPEIKHLKLNNGIKVFFIEKNSLPILNITMMFECGSKYDPNGKKGLSNLFSLLTDEGAGKYSAFELHDEFDFIGANFSVNCDEDYIYYTLQTLTEHIEKALELFASVILKPHLSEESFEREKKRIAIRLLQQKDYPDDMADTLFINKLMGIKSPYAYPINGFLNNIENISLSDMKNFYERNINVENLSIAVTGNISLSELQLRFNQLFSGLNNSSSSYTPEYFNNDVKKNIYIVNYPGASQTEIRFGCKFPGRNEYNIYSRQLFNTILGGQYSSRINQNLREKKGYTYGASSLINYWKNGAFFCVTTSVNTPNTWDAVKEILLELNTIKNGIEVSEMEFAKSTLIKKFPLFFETYNQLNGNLSTLIKHNLNIDYFDMYSDNIQNTNIGEINKVSDLINIDKSIIVLAGDSEKIKTQIDDLNGYELIEINSDEDLFS